MQRKVIGRKRGSNFSFHFAGDYSINITRTDRQALLPVTVAQAYDPRSVNQINNGTRVCGQKRAATLSTTSTTRIRMEQVN